MFILIAALLLLFSANAFSQPISHQNWQNATVSADAIVVNCAPLLLPFELGRLLVESSPTTDRGEMDQSLRSSHAIKVSLQPETGTSDQITSITGCTTNGARVQLSTTDTGDTITVVHTPGAIEFSGGTNVVLDSPLKILTLQRKGGVWVADGGLGGAGSGGNIEDLTTTCASGQVGISDGAGSVNCGWEIVEASDCSLYVNSNEMCLDIDDGYLYVGDGTVAQRSNPVATAGECTLYADIGQLCIDTDTGQLYRGDGVESVLVGGGAAGSQTLDDAFDLGKVINGANSEANALVVGDGTDGFKFFVGTGGPTIKCFQDTNTCDIVFDIPSGNSFRIKYGGTEGIVIDSSGEVTLSNNLIEYKSFWFGAGALSTDATNCANPDERQINGGPKVWTINCADNGSSIIYGNAAMPDSYNGGTVTFELQAVNENAGASGNLSISFSAMCRTDGDTINAVWGTPVAMTIAFNGQYIIEHSNIITVTPQGTCAAGEDIFWRAVLNEASTTTQMTNTYILGVKMEYPTNRWSDD